jgi:hypothetical protein
MANQIRLMIYSFIQNGRFSLQATRLSVSGGPVCSMTNLRVTLLSQIDAAQGEHGAEAVGRLNRVANSLAWNDHGQKSCAISGALHTDLRLGATTDKSPGGRGDSRRKSPGRFVANLFGR